MNICNENKSVSQLLSSWFYKAEMDSPFLLQEFRAAGCERKVKQPWEVLLETLGTLGVNSEIHREEKNVRISPM